MKKLLDIICVLAMGLVGTAHAGDGDDFSNFGNSSSSNSDVFVSKNNDRQAVPYDQTNPEHVIEYDKDGLQSGIGQNIPIQSWNGVGWIVIEDALKNAFDLYGRVSKKNRKCMYPLSEDRVADGGYLDKLVGCTTNLGHDENVLRFAMNRDNAIFSRARSGYGTQKGGHAYFGVPPMLSDADRDHLKRTLGLKDVITEKIPGVKYDRVILKALRKRKLTGNLNSGADYLFNRGKPPKMNVLLPKSHNGVVQMKFRRGGRDSLTRGIQFTQVIDDGKYMGWAHTKQPKSKYNDKERGDPHRVEVTRDGRGDVPNTIGSNTGLTNDVDQGMFEVDFRINNLDVSPAGLVDINQFLSSCDGQRYGDIIISHFPGVKSEMTGETMGGGYMIIDLSKAPKEYTRTIIPDNGEVFHDTWGKKYRTKPEGGTAITTPGECKPTKLPQQFTHFVYEPKNYRSNTKIIRNSGVTDDFVNTLNGAGVPTEVISTMNPIST